MKKIILIFFAVLFVGTAFAETEPVWILCQPDSYVNIREKPSGRSNSVGYAECGDVFETDGKTKGGFLHVIAAIEAGEGWISLGYVVYEQPVYVGYKMIVNSKGRVNARKTIDGKRRCWVYPGDIVTVYWMADWAVTNRGFIKSEYLGAIE